MCKASKILLSKWGNPGHPRPQPYNILCQELRTSIYVEVDSTFTSCREIGACSNDP